MHRLPHSARRVLGCQHATALGTPDHQLFRTYDWDVEMNYTVGAKVKQFDWGLLEGKLEVK